MWLLHKPYYREKYAFGKKDVAEVFKAAYLDDSYDIEFVPHVNLLNEDIEELKKIAAEEQAKQCDS